MTHIHWLAHSLTRTHTHTHWTHYIQILCGVLTDLVNENSLSSLEFVSVFHQNWKPEATADDAKGDFRGFRFRLFFQNKLRGRKFFNWIFLLHWTSKRILFACRPVSIGPPKNWSYEDEKMKYCNRPVWNLRRFAEFTLRFHAHNIQCVEPHTQHTNSIAAKNKRRYEMLVLLFQFLSVSWGSSTRKE